ncbi:MAG: cell division protein FtsZ [Bacteroidales bacterium]|nr:cell division protein FtsZ [Bacteroidales bacterium]
MEQNTYNPVVDEAVLPTSWAPSNAMIKVIGVGGGGGNAVTYMYNQHIEGCSFIICNTDSQVLKKSPVPCKIQMGEGLGAGTDPARGRNCALASQKAISEAILDGETKMLFVTAGMGGGTGTGAAPIVAKIAKDAGILTVGVVTLPFQNEKNGSYSKAVDGIHELERNVDSLLVIDNEKILSVYGDMLIQDAFPKTDEVLATAVRTIIGIITQEGYINVDFQDVTNMMKNSGLALMGCGIGSGENRIKDAVDNAVESPLLLDLDPKTAQNALVNIMVGRNNQGITGNELGDLDDAIREKLGGANRFKRGIVYNDDPDFGDKVMVTIIATGIRMSLLNDAMGSNQGNYIFIDEDYTYEVGAGGEEIILEDTPIEKIGSSNLNRERKFHFLPDDKPVLCAPQGTNLYDLEQTPAIKRYK